MTILALPADALLALGPAALTSRRRERYAGDGTDIALGDLTLASRDHVRTLHHALLRARAELDAALGPARLDDRAAAACLAAIAGAAWWREAIDGAAALRPECAGAPRVARALHDLRSGALTALVVAAELVVADLGVPGDGTRAALLARDHLKIMRNVVRDLDPVRRGADREGHVHDVAMLMEKWSEALHREAGRRAVTVHTEAHWTGGVSLQCLEFAALDRVVYNLANNATRFATDGEVRIVVLPVPPGDARPDDAPDLRIVVVNTVDRAHADTLLVRTRGDLGALFRGGITTGGTGLGLAICAELVANAYGRSAEEALMDGHVGMALGDGYVATWVHWPAVG